MAGGGGDFSRLDNFLSGEGAKGSKGSSGSALPAPVSPSWYNAESRSWYGESDMHGLSKAEKKELVQCAMIVQYSPTGRAMCRRCGTAIDKGVLRLGYPFRWRANEDCYALWLHSECYEPEVFGIKEKDLRTQVFGFEALNNTERARLWKAMRSSGKNKESEAAGKAAAAAMSSGSVGVATKKIPVVQVPSTLAVPMLPFQREGLAWMCQQEESSVRGGVLADEMAWARRSRRLRYCWQDL